MRWVLKDSATGEWFTLPRGKDNSEWSADLADAYLLHTEEQALAAAAVWRDLNKGNLLVKIVAEYPELDEIDLENIKKIRDKK